MNLVPSRERVIDRWNEENAETLSMKITTLSSETIEGKVP